MIRSPNRGEMPKQLQRGRLIDVARPPQLEPGVRRIRSMREGQHAQPGERGPAAARRDLKDTAHALLRLLSSPSASLSWFCASASACAIANAIKARLNFAR